MTRRSYNSSVFINCPLDCGYRPLFHASVFTVLWCDFTVRCAEEESDSGEIRLRKIFRMIRECKYGIHDLSRTNVDRKTRLPRFNMPFELGIFLGAKQFGVEEQDKKTSLVFERRPHSYEKYISDIKGQDIASHDNKPEVIIRRIRDWLDTNSTKRCLPGGSALWTEYRNFRTWLPKACRTKRLGIRELTYHSYANLVYEWIETRRGT